MEAVQVFIVLILTLLPAGGLGAGYFLGMSASSCVVLAAVFFGLASVFLAGMIGWLGKRERRKK